MKKIFFFNSARSGNHCHSFFFFFFFFSFPYFFPSKILLGILRGRLGYNRYMGVHRSGGMYREPLLHARDRVSEDRRRSTSLGRDGMFDI